MFLFGSKPLPFVPGWPFGIFNGSLIAIGGSKHQGQSRCVSRRGLIHATNSGLRAFSSSVKKSTKRRTRAVRFNSVCRKMRRHRALGPLYYTGLPFARVVGCGMGCHHGLHRCGCAVERLGRQRIEEQPWKLR